jgi:predicted NAD/FAD-binding protein
VFLLGIPVDTGFMVLNRVTYPNLLDWFKQNGKKRASLQKATF